MTDSKDTVEYREFSNAARLRLRSSFVKIIEELRMRRSQETESERQIQLLIQDKYQMEHCLESEVDRRQAMEDQHAIELRECKRKADDGMKQLQIELSQHQVYRKIMDKEKESLKNEIRKLQLSVYNGEKKLREMEQRVQVQVLETEQHLSQITQFERNFEEILKASQQLTSEQGKLCKQVKEVEKVNKKLLTANKHQRCLLEIKDTDMKNLQQQLLTYCTQEKMNLEDIADKFNDIEKKGLKKQLEMAEAVQNNLRADCKMWTKKYQTTLRQLTEAHRLLDININTAQTYKHEREANEKWGRELQRTLNDREAELARMRSEVTEMEARFKQETDGLQLKLKEVEEDVEKRDEALTELTNQNLQQAADLNRLMGIMNREKYECDVQTELSLLLMSDIACQAGTETHSQSTETDNQSVRHCASQTINPAMKTSHTQAEQPDCEDRCIQTQTADSQLETGIIKQTDQAVENQNIPNDAEVRVKAEGDCRAVIIEKMSLDDVGDIHNPTEVEPASRQLTDVLKPQSEDQKLTELEAVICRSITPDQTQSTPVRYSPDFEGDHCHSTNRTEAVSEGIHSSLPEVHSSVLDQSCCVAVTKSNTVEILIESILNANKEMLTDDRGEGVCKMDSSAISKMMSGVLSEENLEVGKSSDMKSVANVTMSAQNLSLYPQQADSISVLRAADSLSRDQTSLADTVPDNGIQPKQPVSATGTNLIQTNTVTQRKQLMRETGYLLVKKSEMSVSQRTSVTTPIINVPSSFQSHEVRDQSKQIRGKHTSKEEPSTPALSFYKKFFRTPPAGKPSPPPSNKPLTRTESSSSNTVQPPVRSSSSNTVQPPVRSSSSNTVQPPVRSSSCKTLQPLAGNLSSLDESVSPRNTTGEDNTSRSVTAAFCSQLPPSIHAIQVGDAMRAVGQIKEDIVPTRADNMETSDPDRLLTSHSKRRKLQH